MTTPRRTYQFSGDTVTHPMEEATVSLQVLLRAAHRARAISLDPSNCTVADAIRGLGYTQVEVLNASAYVLHPDGIVRRYKLGTAAKQAVDDTDAGRAITPGVITFLAPGPTQTLEAKRVHMRNFIARHGYNHRGRHTPQRAARRSDRSGAIRLDHATAP